MIYFKFLILISSIVNNFVQIMLKLQESAETILIAQVIAINFMLNVKDWQILLYQKHSHLTKLRLNISYFKVRKKGSFKYKME